MFWDMFWLGHACCDIVISRRLSFYFCSSSPSLASLPHSLLSWFLASLLTHSPSLSSCLPTLPIYWLLTFLPQFFPTYLLPESLPCLLPFPSSLCRYFNVLPWPSSPCPLLTFLTRHLPFFFPPSISLISQINCLHMNWSNELFQVNVVFISGLLYYLVWRCKPFLSLVEHISEIFWKK